MYDPIRDRRSSAQSRPDAAVSGHYGAGPSQPSPVSLPPQPTSSSAPSVVPSAALDASPAVLFSPRTSPAAVVPYPSVLRQPLPSSSSPAMSLVAVNDGIVALSEAAAHAAKVAALSPTSVPQSPATLATTARVNAGGQLEGAGLPGKKRKESALSAPLDLTTADDDFKSSKRSRNVRACDACRRKKIRCDAEQMCSPSGSKVGLATSSGDLLDEFALCGNCVRSSQSCTFSRVPLKRGPNKGFIQALEDRIKTLESNIVDTTTSPDSTPTQTVIDVKGKSRASNGPGTTASTKLCTTQMQFGGMPAMAGPGAESETSSATPTTSPHLSSVPPQYRAIPLASLGLESPLTYATGTFATAWQRCFSLLPPRYLTVGFQHPALRAAARCLINPLDHPDENESFWRSVSDAVGTAAVGSPPPLTLMGGGAESSGAKSREAQALEDEFYALLILFASAARGGRFLGPLLGAAWSKLCGMTGKERDRAEWAHFQLDFWHSLSTHQNQISKLAPTRKDLTTGRSLLGISDDQPCSVILQATTSMAGLCAKANEASSWSEIRENELYATFGLQWAEDIASAVSAKTPANSSMITDVTNDVIEMMRARLAFFMKVYYNMRRLPLVVNASANVVSSLVGDVARLMVLSDGVEKLLPTDVLTAHILGIASLALSWAACVAYALPRDSNTSELIAESTARLAALAHLSSSCARMSSPYPVLLAKIAHYADCFSRTPAEGGDVVRQKFLDFGVLGVF